MASVSLFVLGVLLLQPLASQAFLASDIFATEDERLLDLFCVNSVEDLPGLAAITSTHDKLIIGGIKRSVLAYFKDVTPDFDTEFSPEDTLSTVFQAYYGACASPLKFLKGVKDVLDSSTSLDSLPGIKDDPRYNFDAEYIQETQSTLLELYSQIISAVTSQQNYLTARQLLGQSLRIIERFYSHTNWVELGNDGILEGLGIPGADLGSIAGESEDTCQQSDILTEALTSGYGSKNAIDGEGVPMPPGVAKCSHGGSRDQGLSIGINKDTPDTCFSPHHNWHSQAASLAVDATETYLEFLRDIIGNGNYSQLFDLSAGSAFVVVIDTTGSMSDDINAVKAQVAAIIAAAAEGGVKPSTYVLVPYNDPAVGPAVRTEDTDYFLSAVNALFADGGGDEPEMFWGGLQLALTTAPPYSDIICFTDATGKDGELMQSVFSLAKERFAKVSIITSLVNKQVTDIADYQRICTQTGGLLIPSNGVDIDEIAGILSKSVESSKATIALYNDLNGDNSLLFPVDNFWKEEGSLVEVKIAGGVSWAILRSLSGSHSVDLFDSSSISGSGLGIEVIIKQDGLLYFSFRPDEGGFWAMDLDNSGESASSTYTINVDVTCSFTFMADFRLLDISLSHPAFRVYPGQPIAGSYPTVAVGMVGLEKSKLSSIEYLSMVKNNGVLVRQFNRKANTVEDQFLIETLNNTSPNNTGLPLDTFYMRLEGKDSDGNYFWRMLTSPVQPSSTQVEVTSSSAKLEGVPGSIVTADFSVINHGLDSGINIKVSDTGSYLDTFSPPSAFLGTEQTIVVTASFKIPENANIGAESIVSVTAESQLDFSSNFINVPLKVISGQVDFTPPSCVLTLDPANTGACSGSSQENCADVAWTAEGYAQDGDSGLQTLRMDAGNDATFDYDAFAAGFTGNVTFRGSSTCCTKKAKVVAIDQKGNANSCQIEIGGGSETCSGDWYCDISAGNIIDILEDVPSEVACRDECRNVENCSFYTWMSENHDFPLLPTPALTCFLLTSCDSQIHCEVCFSGPSNC